VTCKAEEEKEEGAEARPSLGPHRKPTPLALSTRKGKGPSACPCQLVTREQPPEHWTVGVRQAGKTNSFPKISRGT
jgi:hypothetical protein